MKYFFLLFFFAPLLSQAQGYFPAGAQAQALSNSTVALENVWAVHHNPGALGNIKGITAGISYQNRFLLKELQSQHIAIATPLKKGVISFGGSFYGYELYRNTRLGLGYAYALTENISFGIQGNLIQLRLAENQKSSWNGTAEFGFLAKISEKWKLGASVWNFTNQKIQYLSDRYATSLRFGAHYAVSKQVSVLIETEKSALYNFSFKTGIDYKIKQQFALRLGLNSGPQTISFGFAYAHKKFSLDISSNYQPNIGLSPSFGLNYNFNNEK